MALDNPRQCRSCDVATEKVASVVAPRASTHEPEVSFWMAMLASGAAKRSLAKRVIEQWCLQQRQPLAALFDLPSTQVARGLELSDNEAKALAAVQTAVPDQARLLDELAILGIQVMTRADEAYPEALAARLPEERLPYLLFYSGNLALLSQPGVAILGGTEPPGAARNVAVDLANLLSADRHHLLGGYGQGVDRAVLDAARASGGYVTMVVPVGLRRFSRVLGALQASIDQGRILVMSPYNPDAETSPSAANARLALVAALAEALILVAPDLRPEELLPSEGEVSARGVWLWAGHSDPVSDAWSEAGARVFDDAQTAYRLVAEGFGVLPVAGGTGTRGADDVGGIDDLYGVEPITFDDADSAIESLSRSGRVPGALARRLRQRNWGEESTGDLSPDDG